MLPVPGAARAVLQQEPAVAVLGHGVMAAGCLAVIKTCLRERNPGHAWPQHDMAPLELNLSVYTHHKLHFSPEPSHITTGLGDSGV